MDARCDRRMISPLLVKFFPEMGGKTSDEWHGFLNLETGCNVDLDEPNPSAFDQWRKALADKGLDVWGVSPSREAAINERIALIKEAENERKLREQEAIAALRVAAPSFTAKDLLK